ncbi:hypothetical protein ACTHGU_17345 [Chitinophagaceae bacterium MMS25-I14]
MKHIILFLFTLFLTHAAFSQAAPAFELSAALDLPLTGWNKVLQVRNGNTLLFHLEPNKGILVKVFDPRHKEVATVKYICELIDVNTLEMADFKGLYDINGEAVLFMQQPYFNRTSLFRMRFDIGTGKLLKEEIVERSTSLANETLFYICKAKDNDNYAIFHYRNIVRNPEERMTVSLWNGKHEKIKEAAIPVPLEKLYAAKYLGLSVEKDAIYCGIGLLKQNAVDNFQQYIYAAQLRNQDTGFHIQQLEVDDRVPLFLSVFTPNEFSDAESMMTLGMYASVEKSGNHTEYAYFPVPYFSTYQQKDFAALSLKTIPTEKMDAALKGFTDTFSQASWIPVKMYTNKLGASFLSYELQGSYYATEKGKDVYRTLLGGIGINILNDEGQPFFSTVIPKKQQLNTYLSAEESARRRTSKPLFRSLQEYDYDEQFASFDLLEGKNNYFIIFNDDPSNFDKNISDTLTTIIDYNITSAVLYTFNKKRELAHQYLFGKPEAGCNISCQVESSDYDQEKNSYAVLVLNRKNHKTNTCIAWCHFDEETAK